MHTTRIIFLSLLTLIPTIQATTCTTSVSTPWPDNNDFSSAPFMQGSQAFGGAQDIDDCTSYCAGDMDCFQQCSTLILYEQCLAIGGDDCENEQLHSGKRDNWRKRDGELECESEETCYEYTDGSLLCVDLNDGLYHDDQDGHGSLVDGTYTSADGGVVTGTSTSGQAASTSVRNGATTTKSISISSASSAPSSLGSEASSGSSATKTASTRIVASATSAVASATSNAAVVLNAGSVIGAVGLLVGFAL